MRTPLALLLLPLLLAADWPQWLGPNRAGVWDEPNSLDKLPADLKPAWEVPVGQGYAGPAVAAGAVYVMDRATEAGAYEPKNAFDRNGEVAGNERVQCFDAGTGKRRWEHSYPCRYKISYSAGPRCTPTVDGNLVYTLGAMGDLKCLTADKGEVKWAKNFPKEYGANVPLWGYAAHPLVDGPNLICLVGGAGSKLVVAFDKLTGKEKWAALSYESGDFGYNSPVIHTLAGKRQLLIWHPKALVSLNPDSGEKLWEVPVTSKQALNAPTLRVQGDRVFATSFYDGGLMVEVTPAGPKVVWKSAAKGERPSQTRDLSSIMPAPVWQGDTIYGVDSYGELRALDAATGKRLWVTMAAVRGRLTPAAIKEREEPSEVQPWAERWACAFLVPNGGKTWIFNEQGELILAKLTREKYEELGRVAVLEPTNKLAGRPVVWSHPAFAEGAMFARNDAKLVRVKLTK